jgi:hypothetical protein
MEVGVRRLGFILLCVYIAFNVLDIDGSEFQYRLGPALAAESATAESDRGYWSTPLPRPAGTDATALSADSQRRLDQTLARLRPLQIQRLLLHRPPARLEGSSSTVPPADPA